MRRLLIALALLGLLLAGIAAVAWMNRVPLAEWAIENYQPETPFGPVTVRIGEITLSSVTVTEIRARYRGPITIQDAGVEYRIGMNGHLSLPKVRIGSLNAALSFADWYDLLDTLTGSAPGTDGPVLPELPVSVGTVTVETLDLYAETPKGYALLNGEMAFRGTADLRRADALARLAEGLEGNLLMSAGAAAFPVSGATAGREAENGAIGGGSMVLTVSFARNTARVEAVTPLRLDLEIAEPLPGLPAVPAGTYRADIGSDETPFRMTVGYGVDPSPGLRSFSFSPFPFALETPFGTAEARATTAPMTMTDAQGDPAALPVSLKGALDLSALPLPAGITVDISGGFEIDKGDKTVVALDKGFRLSADLSASPLLAEVPQAILDHASENVSLSTGSRVAVEFASDAGGHRFTGSGALTVRSGGIRVAVPDGFEMVSGPQSGIRAGAKAVDITLSPGEGSLAGNAALKDLSVTLGTDATAGAEARFNLETPQARSKGSFSATHSAGGTDIAVTDASAELPDTDLSIPSFSAKARLAETGIDLSAAIEEILLGDLRALIRPLSLSGHVTPDDQGFAFNASGSIDDIVSVKAHGRYSGGDLTMGFESGDIPLGPEGADLSALTELVDLGRADPNGSIRVEGELTYQHESISGYADLHIAEIGSVLADGTEISILGTVTFDLSRPPATLRPATLTGVLSSDILGSIPFKETFTLRETGEMEVQSLEAKFLGGTITLREGLANPSEGSLTGRLHAARVDLDALADMLNIDGLEGTGSLTGELGFQVMEDAVIVEAGELRAENPGVLRYRGEALRAAAAGNENLALLVQALENFHYEVLTLGIDIPEFGEGLVTLHLEGSNPDVLEGYPFDVTINLESEYGRLITTFLNLYQEVDVILQGVLR